MSAAGISRRARPQVSHIPDQYWLTALLALTMLRLILADVAPLSPDETYYWLWSLHVQPGYFDHPPMVAMWIRAGTDIFGPAPLGIRLLGPLAAAAGSVLLWDAGETILPGRNAGLIAAALFNATILLGAGSIIMTPDTPLVFFWTMTMAATGRWLESRDGRWWLAIGLAAGLALLSKYTALLLIISVGFWMLTRRDLRRELLKPWPWAGLAVALLVFAPDIYWNAVNGWVSYFKQGGRVGQFDPARSTQFLAELVLGQIGLATPLSIGLAAAGLWELRRRVRRASDAGASLLLWLSLLPALVCVEHVISGRVQANWPAIIYPAAFLAAAGLAAPVLEKWLRPSLGLGLGLTFLVYAEVLASPWPIPAQENPIALQLSGWQDLASQAAVLNPAFLTADDYATNSELAYYAPKRIPVTGMDARWRYFTMNTTMKLSGVDGLLVTRRSGTPCIEQIGTLTRTSRGQVVATYRLCRITGQDDMVLLPRP